MNFSNNDNNLKINENIILSIENNTNENHFLLKKILKENNKRNKNKFNISNQYSKNKSSSKSNTYSKLEKKNKAFSFVNKNTFENEILSKVIEKNNKIFNLKELNGNYYNEIPRILTFKHNFIIHRKNLSLYENKNTNEKINQNNNIKYKGKNKLSEKSQKCKIYQKFKRPNSAVFRYFKSKYTPIFHNLELNDVSLNHKINNFSQTKQNHKIRGKYNNLSLTNIRNRGYTGSKKNKNKLIINDIEDSFFHFLSRSRSRQKSSFEINKLYEPNYTNIDAILNSKLYNKIQEGQFFRKKAIPIINKKYLVYLPNDIKKDANNKYNFFSYLVTENINYNNKLYNNLSNFKNHKKNKNYSHKNKNNFEKIKQNYTQYNINQNQNLFINYKLNCRKEEDFMSYLKNLDYEKKHPKNMKDNINLNYYEKSSKLKINNMKNNIIYKPVKIKNDDFSHIYENKLSKRKLSSNEEENDLCEKIKSQPFNIKNKKK